MAPSNESPAKRPTTFVVARNSRIPQNMGTVSFPTVDLREIASKFLGQARELSEKVKALLDGTAPTTFRPRHDEFVARQERQRRSFCVGSNQAPAFAAILPGDSVAEQVLASGVLNFLNLYNTALVVRLVLTWFPNPPEFIASPLSTICDPYLNLFRGLIPPLGGTLDFSPILAFVVLNIFTSSAAALPAEIPANLPAELGPDGKTIAGRQATFAFVESSKTEQIMQQFQAGRRQRKAEAALEGTAQ